MGGWIMGVSMIPFIPSLVWEKIEKICALNQIKHKIGYLMKKLASFEWFESAQNMRFEWFKWFELWNIESNELKENILFKPQATALNQCLSLFFFAYIFIGCWINFSEQWTMNKLNEILNLDQQWTMFATTSRNTSFNLLIGEIEIIYANNTHAMQHIVLNDLLTSNWRKATVFEGESKYKRLSNPTYFNPSWHWTRLFDQNNRRRLFFQSMGFKKCCIELVCQTS